MSTDGGLFVGWFLLGVCFGVLGILRYWSSFSCYEKVISFHRIIFILCVLCGSGRCVLLT